MSGSPAARLRRPPRLSRSSGSLLAVVVLIATPNSLCANVWTLSPQLQLALEATDNALLAPDGAERSDLIGVVSPRFTLRRDGPKLDAALAYRPTSRTYARESQEDRTTHTLNGRTEWEPIDETLFLTAAVTRTEETESLLEPIGIGDSTPRDNLQQTTYYSFSPMVRTRYGAFARQEVRYTFDELRYHRSARSNSRAHRGEYALNSGPAFPRLFWQLNGSYLDEQYENGPEGTFGEASATLGRRFGRALQLFGVVGREYNDYPTSRDDDDGSYWEVGVGYSPTRVTRIEARYGERYFGETRTLSVDHRSRRATYRLSYNEGITSTRDRRGARFNDLATLLGLSVDELFDQFTFDEIALLLALNGLDDSAIVQRYALTQTWRAAWRYDTGRSLFGLTAFEIRSESEQRSGLGSTSTDQERRGLNASWRWSMSPLTSTEVGVGFTRSKFLDLDRQDDLWNLRLGVQSQRTPSLVTRLAYRHQRRESDNAANEYRENAILASLTVDF